jgi:hypothetical protein
MLHVSNKPFYKQVIMHIKEFALVVAQCRKR